ncbi:MAG: amylo-alpha-1,6-glucosidase [Bacteroidales bacterium]
MPFLRLWDEQNGCLADVVRGDFKDLSIRPNQIIAVALPYRILPDEMNNRILKVVKKELLHLVACVHYLQRVKIIKEFIKAI